MRNRLERRRLTLRAAALCIVLVLLCGCLLPAFAEGPERTDSVPDQTWDEEIEDEPAGDEEDDIRTDEPVLLPAEGGIPVVVDGLDDIGLPDETPTPDSGAVKADEHFERTYLFWLSESDEADGGLPYAEQIVGSGEELLMPEEPEVEEKSFRFWYSRGDEGTAIRFMPDEGPLWPEADSECSLYACFTDDEAQQEEPVLDEEEDIAVLPELSEERPAVEEETPLDEAEQPEKDRFSEEDADLADDSVAEDKNALPADELDEDAPGWGDWTQEELAAVFLLKTPTSLPGSNDPSQWAPDNSECKWVGKVKTYGAAWEDNGKNILTNVSDYVVSWPGGATGDAWSLKPGDDYWDEVVDEKWDEYKDTIEKQTGIMGLTQEDLESIVVTPYKISRNNGTEPDKHIDCIISVKSRKNFTARFNVRAPGEDDYSIRESREYQSGERVEETTADIEKELDIGGARYVFDGWYKELPGSVTDEPDPKEKVSQDEWEKGQIQLRLQGGGGSGHKALVLLHADQVVDRLVHSVEAVFCHRRVVQGRDVLVHQIVDGVVPEGVLAAVGLDLGAVSLALGKALDGVRCAGALVHGVGRSFQLLSRSAESHFADTLFGSFHAYQFHRFYPPCCPLKGQDSKHYEVIIAQ